MQAMTCRSIYELINKQVILLQVPIYILNGIEELSVRSWVKM
jgi:hypothetical protein